MSKPSGRSTPMSKSCERAKRAPDAPKWIPGVARNRSRGHWRSPRPSGSSRTTRLHTPCNEFGSDANGGSHSVRIFPIGSRLRTLPARSRGLKAFGGIPTSGPCRGDRSKNRTLEFGRVVLELFRWNIASWAANGARFHRSLCDAGRLTTRPRVPSMGSVPSAPAGTTRHRERDHEQAEGQPRAHDGGKPLGRQGGQRRRWGGGLRRTRSARSEFRSPADPRRSPADALHPVRCGYRQPLRLVPVINHVQRAEQPIHVSRPGDALGCSVNRETPRRLEFVLDATLRAELGFDCVDRPRRVVHSVGAVILEGAGEDFRGPCLQSETVNVHRGWNRQERAHAEGWGRASVARRGAAVRLTRRPSVAV